MHIAIIRNSSNYLNPYLYNCQEIGLAKALEDKGHFVDIYMKGNQTKDYVEVLTPKVRIFFLKGTSLPGQNSFYPQIFNYFRQNKYDIIQVSEDSQIMSVFISSYARRNNIPVILWQGMYENYRNPIKRVIQYFFDVIFLPILRKNVSLVICKTSAAEGYMKRKKFYNTKVLGVGLNITSFKEEDIDWYKRLNIANDKKILLYVGKIEQRRNPFFLMDVIETLSREDFVLVIVGDGPLRNSVSSRIYEKSLFHKIKLVENIPQEMIGSLYKQAYIFLLPSFYEIYGMVVLECMFFGLPIIASVTAGTADLIDNNKDGFLIEEFDKNKWSKLIDRCLSDHEMVKMFKERLMKKFREGYSWERIGEKYEEVYKSILK